MDFFIIKVLLAVLFIYVMTRPDHAFDPTVPFRGIVVTGMLSCISFVLLFYTMLSLYFTLGQPDDMMSSVLCISCSAAGYPFVLLKFYWDHIKSQRETELREW